MHSDVCGPMPTRSLGCASYFVTFIDDATRKVWVYAMKSKDKTFSYFQKFLSSVKTQSGRKLKALCSDNSGEYVSHELDDSMQEGESSGSLLLHIPQPKMVLLKG